MLHIGMKGLAGNGVQFDDIKGELQRPTDKRIFAVIEAMRQGIDIDEIHNLSKIDKWFLFKIKNILDMEKKLQEKQLKTVSKDLIKEAKQLGFSDEQLSLFLKSSPDKIRSLRKRLKIVPVVKQIDTLAAEYPARTNYLYLTYNGDEDDVSFNDKNTVIVLGGGAYRIGSSVEFDWCCVNAVQTLRKLGHTTIMINYNPETVSTDYDICDKLYFEELSFESVLDICDKESPKGVVVSMGGQIPNNLAMPLHKAGVKILGTTPVKIDNAEDRFKFSKLCDDLNIEQPAWRELTSLSAAIEFAEEVSYPVLVRPSYVLSGSAMNVVLNQQELDTYLKVAADVSAEHPVVISDFITGAREIEIDAVANKGQLIVYAISEHVENAGVHSGDATMVLPAQKTYLETSRRIKEIAVKLAASLEITGPFNIQFVAKENRVMVIECNLRASRSFPFVSKVYNVNFIDLATKAIAGRKISPVEKSHFELAYVGVKASQFSFSRLKGADPVLDVEMTSTGEVACLGTDINDAFLKSIMSTGMKLPKRSVLVSVSGNKNRYDFLESFKKIDELGFKIFATEHTSVFLQKHGIESKMLYKVHEKRYSGFNADAIFREINDFGFYRFLTRRLQKKKLGNVLDYLIQGGIDLVINIPKDHNREALQDAYAMRRITVDFGIPLITNLQLADLFIDSLQKKKDVVLETKSWKNY